jgi:Tfp pilus assembly pilus retraction ATPase PilT
MHIDDMLIMANSRCASDLHLKAGSLPVLRINGELVAQEDILNGQ